MGCACTRARARARARRRNSAHTGSRTDRAPARPQRGDAYTQAARAGHGARATLTRAPGCRLPAPTPRAEPLTLPHRGPSEPASTSGCQASRLAGRPTLPASHWPVFRSWRLIGRHALATDRRRRRRRRARIRARQQGAGPRGGGPESGRKTPGGRVCGIASERRERAAFPGLSVSSAADPARASRHLRSRSAAAGLLATSDLEGRRAGRGGRGQEQAPERKRQQTDARPGPARARA